MAMLWQLFLHQEVIVTKLIVGYKNVDDDSFLIRENLPINQIGGKIISNVRVAG